MNLYDYILEIISKNELKITREEVDDAIRLYIKAYNSNPKYKEDFIYKRISGKCVDEILKEEYDKLSDYENIFISSKFEWSEHFNRVEEHNIINGKKVLTFINTDDIKIYYDQENELLLFEDKEEYSDDILRISPSVIRRIKNNKCIVNNKFILTYDDKGRIRVYHVPYLRDEGFLENVSKFISNFQIINDFSGDNQNKKRAKLILKEITDRVEKNFLRVVYFMIGEKYGIKNKKEAGLEYIFKKNTPKNIKNIPKIFLENEEKKEYKYILHKGIILLFINEWLTRNSGFSEKTDEKFKKIKATNIKFIKCNIDYTDHDNLKKIEDRLEIYKKIKIIEDNLKKLMNKNYDLQILEDINNDLKIISRLCRDVDFYLIDITSELKKIKKCTEKIKLEMKEEYEVRRDLEREEHYYQELNNESENDFNESDE